MKRANKKLGVLVLTGLLVMTLASCSNLMEELGRRDIRTGDVVLLPHPDGSTVRAKAIDSDAEGTPDGLDFDGDGVVDLSFDTAAAGHDPAGGVLALATGTAQGTVFLTMSPAGAGQVSANADGSGDSFGVMPSAGAPVFGPVLDASAEATNLKADAAALTDAGITFGSGGSSAGGTTGVTVPVTGDNGPAIRWGASRAGIVSFTGGTATLTAPAEDKTVTLYATITQGDFVIVKAFAVVVKSGTVVSPTAVPTTPAAATVTPDGSQLTLTWSAVAGATAYEIWYHIADNSAAASKWGDRSFTNGTITGLTNGTLYYVWLKAKNSSGTSAFSPVASGTPAIPITYISTAAELRALALSASNLYGHYIQTADIDLENTAFTPLGVLYGTYDGGNFEIRNINVTITTSDHAGGLVRVLAEGAVLKNIKLRTVKVERTTNDAFGQTGGLVGAASNATIENCSVSGGTNPIVIALRGHVGGILGYGNGVTITKCWFSGWLSKVEYTTAGGGIVGLLAGSSTIDRCFTTSTTWIRGRDTGDGANDWAYIAGGLVGEISASSGTIAITNCYSQANVNQNEGLGQYIGGLIGEIETGAATITLTNCYSSGLVNGQSALDRLVAVKGSATGTGLYFDNALSMGAPTTSTMGTGKTTPEMKQQATFVGWDFTNIWQIAEGTSYPTLR